MNKSDKHPGYIVRQSLLDYDSLKITHSKYRSKNKLNETLNVNPNPKDKKQSYVEKRVRRIPKYKFGEVLQGWSISEEDKKKIDQILSKYEK